MRILPLEVINDDDVLGECQATASHNESEGNDRILSIRLIGLVPRDKDSFTGSSSERDVLMVERRLVQRLHGNPVEVFTDENTKSRSLDGRRAHG